MVPRASQKKKKKHLEDLHRCDRVKYFHFNDPPFANEAQPHPPPLYPPPSPPHLLLGTCALCFPSRHSRKHQPNIDGSCSFLARPSQSFSWEKTPREGAHSVAAGAEGRRETMLGGRRLKGDNTPYLPGQSGCDR
ncbi:hypothetical protein BaRGS_00003364 [Batillaria attramentaria]|uniref:Uncharacterized protein n=1 Tax=Batillaria attramentaria TaxID=370345 RepID=A0ABD0M0J4_9CAEN